MHSYLLQFQVHDLDSEAASLVKDQLVSEASGLVCVGGDPVTKYSLPDLFWVTPPPPPPQTAQLLDNRL